MSSELSGVSTLSRIFISLSMLPIVLIFVTMGAGWWIGDYNGAFREVIVNQTAADRSASKSDQQQRLLANLSTIEEPQRRFNVHFQLGLATALATVLINSLSVTYLIGTSRWVKEVTDVYGLDSRFAHSSTQIKRHSFPWALAGVAAIITVTALGAAADPGTLSLTTSDWVLSHATAAMLGASLIVWAILVQAYDIHRNSLVIDQVVEEVRLERLARGLDVEG